MLGMAMFRLLDRVSMRQAARDQRLSAPRVHLQAWLVAVAVAIAIKPEADLVSNRSCGRAQGFIDMNISLRNAARSMSQKGGDRELRVTKAAGNAGKGVTENVRRYVLYTSPLANAIKHAHDPDEMALSPVSGEKEFRACVRLGEQKVNGSPADDPPLRSRLGRREMDRVLFLQKPFTFEAERLKAAKPRKEQKPNGSDTLRMLKVCFRLPECNAEPAQLGL